MQYNRHRAGIDQVLSAEDLKERLLQCFEREGIFDNRAQMNTKLLTMEMHVKDSE